LPAVSALILAASLLGGPDSARAQTAPPSQPLGELKKLSLEELMNIEVTSVSKRPEKLLDAASAIQVVTSEDILRSGAATLPETLRLAGNLQVAAQNSHDWNISARGFNTDLANKLLVLIDGRTVYTPLFSGVFWDVQDYLLEDVDRIEVISGPGGTLWGANAVNGVINITTKSAKDTQGLFLEAGGGSELETIAGARYGGTLAPGVYFRVYGKYFSQADGALATGAGVSNGWHMSRGGFRIDSEARPQNTLTLQGDYYDGTEDQSTGGSNRSAGATSSGGGRTLFRRIRTRPCRCILTGRTWPRRSRRLARFPPGPCRTISILSIWISSTISSGASASALSGASATGSHTTR